MLPPPPGPRRKPQPCPTGPVNPTCEAGRRHRSADPTAEPVPTALVHAGQRMEGHKLRLKNTVRHLDPCAGMRYRESCQARQFPSGLKGGLSVPAPRVRSNAPRGNEIQTMCPATAGPSSFSRHNTIRSRRAADIQMCLGDPANRACASHSQRQHLRFLVQFSDKIRPPDM